MTTKDHYLPGKADIIFGETLNDQCSNLNLNHNNQSLHFDNVQSISDIKCTKKTQKYDFMESTDLQAKKENSSWNKSNKHLSPSLLNLRSEEQHELKKSKIIKNSTLSLHIAAYENSTETDSHDLTDSKTESPKSKSEVKTLIKKYRFSKQVFTGLCSSTTNPFEFPRQQGDSSNHPELMQFKASQRLRNPNEENLNVNETNNITATPLEQSNEAANVAILQRHPSDLRQIANPSNVVQPNCPQTVVEQQIPQQQQSDHSESVDSQRTTGSRLCLIQPKMSDPSPVSEISQDATGNTTPKEDPPVAATAEEEMEQEQVQPQVIPIVHPAVAVIPLRGSAMPVLPQHGKVYIGPGAKKEAQVLGLGLSSLHRSERSDLDRAKRFAMDQSIKYLMQKQQTAHQENQQKVAMYAQALSLMARVYVGSISFEIREDQLRETFGEYGPIKSVNMSFDASTGHHKGYAFLEYEIPEAALLAQEAMNGLMMGGRNIKVERGRVQLQLGRPQTMPQAQPIIDMIMTEARKYHRIYVASVHEDLNESDLRTVFSSFGNIIKCQLAKSTSGKHRGFGYIEFDTPRAAAEAIAGMNMFDLGGKLMRVGKCITPPEALSYIVPNTQTQLPTAAAMAAAAITARIQAQEAAGKSGIKPPPSPELSPIRDHRRRRSPPKERERRKAKSPLKITGDSAATHVNGTTSNGKPTSTRFGERSAIAPPPSIIDPLARGPSSPKPISIPTPKHRPTFAPAATVEVVEKPKAQKPKDILSRIKIQPTLKPGVKAQFAPVTTGFGAQESNIFEDEQDKKATLSITGPETSKALAMIMDSKAVAVVKDGQKAGGSGSAATSFKRKYKKITGPKAKGPQLNTIQALQAAEKAGAISDQIHQAGQENDEQPLSAMEIGEIRGNDARHLLMRKLMRNEHTRVMLLKKMVYPEEVDDFLKDEVKEECEKHGPVKDVTIVQVRGEVRIFVQYEKMEDATKARGVFDKRWFNGRQVDAVPYDEELLNHQDYLG